MGSGTGCNHVTNIVSAIALVRGLKRTGCVMAEGDKLNVDSIIQRLLEGRSICS